MLPRIQKNTREFAHLSVLYAGRRGARNALAAYPTLDALLAALHGPRRAERDVRCRLLCAVLAEHEAAPSPLWVAIAFHAFRGMLVRLSRVLVGVDRDEADAFVAAGLVEAMRRVHPDRDPDRVAMYVRQETRRAVFAALHRDARGREHWEEEDAEEAAEERLRDADPAPLEPTANNETFADEADADAADQEAEVFADAGDTSDAHDGDDPMDEPVERDPLAVERASRLVFPDALPDPESSFPLEDRLFFHHPTVDGIPDEYLLRAHAVPGGLHRLTNHLFEDASARERENVYRALVRRAQRLLARGE